MKINWSAISGLVAIFGLIVAIRQCQLAEQPINIKEDINNTSNNKTNPVPTRGTNPLKSQSPKPESNKNKREVPNTFERNAETQKMLPISNSLDKKNSKEKEIINEHPKPLKVIGDYGCVWGETDGDIPWYDGPKNHTNSKEPLIPPGTKVTLGKVENGMWKITLPNGRVGWVPCEKIHFCQ